MFTRLKLCTLLFLNIMVKSFILSFVFCMIFFKDNYATRKCLVDVEDDQENRPCSRQFLERNDLPGSLRFLKKERSNREWKHANIRRTPREIFPLGLGYFLAVFISCVSSIENYKRVSFIRCEHTSEWPRLKNLFLVRNLLTFTFD